METIYLECKGTSEDEEKLAIAGAILQKGGLVAFPTETVYGLGGDALNQESSHKIYAAKGRPSDNPLIVHIAKWEDIYPITKEVSREAELVAKAFWPGPLTMILKKSDSVPYETTGGLDTVAVRLPSHETARRLIELGGGYIAAPSANTSGKPSPTNARDVAEDMDGKIDAVIDGGQVGIGIESTILDMTVSPPQILRPGYITREMLEEVLGLVSQDVTMFEVGTGQAPKAPGMKYRHYAPKGKLVIVKGNRQAVVDYINSQAKEAHREGLKTGVIATQETIDLYQSDVVLSAGSRQDEDSIARHLYSCLREFDRQDAQILFSESFEAPGIGMAVMNRLLKAAGHQVIEV